MLRVGLTGGLGSGKTTAAKMFAACGAYVFYADEIARELMQPGEQVYAEIIEHFGPGVVAADGALNRAALARMAFGDGRGDARIAELEAIIHPATIARQVTLIDEVAVRDPDAVVMVESALIFETKHGGEGGWHRRFDKIIFVKASQQLQVERFVERTAGGKTLSDEERTAAEAEARKRLARQVETERNASRCDYVLTNDGPVEQLRVQVEALWAVLTKAARQRV
ncbi:MAG: dephospho-CoA kinase [Acidobacteriota bacterium]|nr:dephospho-CoA kinase [Acidobacteriota bacterium]